MGLQKPFHRIFREFIKSNNSGYSSWSYVVDKQYAKNPYHYTRAFLMIQEDVQKLFEYIEPADINLKTYSHRIHELLMRICIEVEANFKAILRENIYSPTSKQGKSIPHEKWNINDYSKINISHRLDGYIVELPLWNGKQSKYQPFKEWENNGSLSWYQAYNKCKHDRNENFELANLQNLLAAFAGLFALLSSQFGTQDFEPGSTFLSMEGGGYYEGSFGIGGYLKIEFPSNWPDHEKHNFDWSVLKLQSERFEKFDYNST